MIAVNDEMCAGTAEMWREVLSITFCSHEIVRHACIWFVRSCDGTGACETCHVHVDCAWHLRVWEVFVLFGDFSSLV